jgi:3-hydroxyisobutyrate dehydrogenase-like beta-hydroxyacid dehydrogenase
MPLTTAAPRAHTNKHTASGGPRGAAAGTLTCMLGGAPGAVASVLPSVRCFAKHARHVGPAVGCAHAVKVQH